MNDAEKMPHEEQGLPEQEFSELMQSISTMAPLVRGLTGGKGGGKCSRREGLLLALKPYLSPTRCEVADYLIRIGRLQEMLGNLRSL